MAAGGVTAFGVVEGLQLAHERTASETSQGKERLQSHTCVHATTEGRGLVSPIGFVNTVISGFCGVSSNRLQLAGTTRPRNLSW